MNHHPGCSEPEPRRYIGHLGDPMLHCPECRRNSRDTEHTDRPADPVPATPDTPEPGRYYCAAHQQPVTRRGKGCGACDQERHAARKRRRARRSTARTP